MPPSSRHIHLITCEYPPLLGGVGDYTQVLANALVQCGKLVHVWCPRGPQAGTESGITVHPDFGCFSVADTVRVDRLLGSLPHPLHLVVQWVPHGYGWRAVNIAFCAWLLRRSLLGDTIDLMVHEARLDVRGTWRQRFAAVIQHLMLAILQLAAHRVFIAIPAWKSKLKAASPGRARKYIWCPVPSNVPFVSEYREVARLRSMLLGSCTLLLGHFSTHTPLVADRLTEILQRLLPLAPEVMVVLIGSNGARVADALALLAPQYRDRVRVTGALPIRDVSLYIQACDVMLQPYPGGINSRSGAMMAALAHGKPVVTTRGCFTEDVWQNNEPVLLANDGDIDALTQQVLRLLQDSRMRVALGERAFALYESRFDVRHTVHSLFPEMATEVETSLCLP